MFRGFSTAFAAVIIALLVAATPATANQPPKLNFGKELNNAACGKGTLVVNVTQNVVNGGDSKVGGGFWAFVDYNLHIKIFETDVDTYCAIIKSQGQFTAIAGSSPQGTGTIDAGVSGTFQGGYRTPQFVATFDPQAATHGNLGTLDFQCDAGGSCAGSIHDWTHRYFPGAGGIGGVGLDWWGWIYHGGSNGTWVNAGDGNQGDIVS